MATARRTDVPSLLLKLGPLDKVFRLGVAVDQPFVDLARAVEFLVPDFKLDIRAPRLLVRFPRHPALKHLTGAGDVAEEFLEEDIFVPDLVDPREEGDGAVKQVPGVRDVARLEFLFWAWFRERSAEPSRFVCRL